MVAVLVVAAVMVVPVAPAARVLAALAPSTAVHCAALQLQVTPGVHPATGVDDPHPPPDAPRTPLAVALPLYPGLSPLPRFIGSPFAEIEASPYLQTASAELHSGIGSFAIQLWYQKAMTGCGWRSDGSWDGNAGTFPHGISFARGPRNSISVDVGFADQADGSTDVAVAIEVLRYPVPPARARVHGPFMQLRITVGHMGTAMKTTSTKKTHVLVTNQQQIAGVVRAIDSLNEAYTVPSICFGGLRNAGPVWLTFVRPDGTKVHAYETGPGDCGGLAVNGFRWLLDPGRVWSKILALARAKT